MKRHYSIVILIFELLVNTIHAQNYKIIDVVTSEFPIMEAHYINTDNIYKPQAYTIDSVSILENGEDIEPLDFTLPKQNYPLSIVFALDISSSMQGDRFEMLKATTKEFIKKLPLEQSEIAITSFNGYIFLNSDFTHNINTLYNTIDDLWAEGETSYNQAFLNPNVGLTQIVKQGQYKKLIFFISDGLSNVNALDVYKSMNKENTTVDCITIGIPISDELKLITNKSGGKYYSNLNTKAEISLAFKKLYNMIQEENYGLVKWKSNYSCNPDKEIDLSIGQHKFNFNFQIPEGKVGSIDVTPANIEFESHKPGKTYYKPVFITGNNIGLNISTIESSNASVFGLKSQDFPIVSDVNESRTVEVSFLPQDTSFVSSEYTIKNEGCPDAVIEASSKGSDKLIITNPKENDEYVTNSQIPIEWNGIGKGDYVDFYYQEEGNKNWVAIGHGNNLRKDWKAINLKGRMRIRGEISHTITFASLLRNKVAIIDGSDFVSAYYSEDGKGILSLSSDSILKKWYASSGFLHYKFEYPIKGDYTFMPGFKRIIDVSSGELSFYSYRNGLKMKDLDAGEQKNLTSLTHVKDKEIYVTLNNFQLLVQDNDYLDMTSAPVSGYSVARKESNLLVFKTGNDKKEFAIKLDPSFQKSVLHSTEPVLAVSNLHSTVLYNLKSHKELLDLNEESFYQFSRYEKYLITMDSLHYNIYDIISGDKLFSVNANNTFSISADGRYLEETDGPEFKVTDLANKQVVYEKKYQNITQPQFFPKSDKLLFIKSDSLFFMDLQKNEMIGKVYCEPGLVKMMDISPDEKSVLITGQSAIASFDIDNLIKADLLGNQNSNYADTTGYFNVILPEPKVKDKIRFPKHFVNNTLEKVIPDVIINPENFSVYIDRIYIESENSCFRLVSKPGEFFMDPKQNSSVEIAFTPQKTGLNTGKLFVISGDKEYVCSLEGEGITKNFELLTPQIIFPALNVYDKEDSIVPLLRNTGTEPITIKGLRVNPYKEKSFSLMQNKKNEILEEGDTLWSQIAFSPVKRGRQNAILEIKMNDQDWFHCSSLFGEGIGKRNIIIAVNTIHAVTKAPLKSLVTLTALQSASVVYQQYTDAKGEIEFKANTDLNYSLSAELDGYFSSSENIDLEGPQSKDTIHVTLELTPINSDSPVRLNNVFFESGKADLLDISIPELQRIADFMKSKENMKLEIHGHTDNVGSEASNMELSKQRALSVKKYIVNQGIPTERISIKYFGESRPVKGNDTPEGRKANRRVEIKFIK